MSMRTRWQRNLERIRTEPGLKKNVAVMGALIVLALVAGGVVLSNQRFIAPWSDQYEFSAEFEATPGIAPGNGQEVRINGVIVGQITGARVDDQGRAVLDFDLEPGHDVYRDATLVLRPKSPLNEMYVTIDPGTPEAGRVARGETLPITNTRRPIQIEEVLGALDDQARGAITALLAESDAALAKAPEQLPSGLDAMAGSMEAYRPVFAQLDQRREYLKRLVTAVAAVSETLGDDDERLIALADSLETTLGVVSDESGPLASALQQLPELSGRIGSATRAVERLTTQLDPTLADVREATRDLPPALDRLASTSKRLRETATLARPVVRDARPMLADLVPYSRDLAASLRVFQRTTGRLDPVTATLLDYLPDVGAFFVNTRSVTSMRDGNGGILRGMLEVTPTSLPLGFAPDFAPDEPAGPLG